MSSLIAEVKDFCYNQGFEIDRIAVTNLFDADLNTPKERIKSDSQTFLEIVKLPSGKIEAIISMFSETEAK